MTQFEFVQIAKLLQREQAELENRIVDFENHFNTFRRFDELDAVELQHLIIKKQYIDELEFKILRLIDFFYKISNGVIICIELQYLFKLKKIQKNSLSVLILRVSARNGYQLSLSRLNGLTIKRQV